METITLVSFDICPFVERTRVVLLEKHLPFDQTVIDLWNKPAWFIDLSPRGKVPVLRYGAHSIFESTVINEFLEELAPTPAMLPTDLVARARARAWIAFNNEALLPALSKLWFGPRTETALSAARAEVEQTFARLEEHFAKHPPTPYFTGAEFSLVDASFAPNFTRLEATGAMGHGDLLGNHPKVKAYADHLLARPSVIAAQHGDLTNQLIAVARKLAGD